MTLYWGTIIFLFGLIIGSFLNCLIWRLYKAQSLLGRSYCPHCSQMIAWFDNIPLLSFISLRGRCRHCRKKISWQYPAIELATAILFLAAWQLRLGGPILSSASAWLLVRDLVAICFLVVIFVYDARWQLVPVTLIWLVSALIFIIQLYLGYSIFSLLFFSGAGALFFALQYLATRRRGIGEGDIWLGLFLGSLFPHGAELFLLILIAYSLGAVAGTSLLIWGGKRWKSAIALGPFLALGALVTLFFGEKIIAWYLGLLV